MKSNCQDDPNCIRLLLVDHQPDTLEGMKTNLSKVKRPAIQVVGEANNGQSCLERIEHFNPNVVILGLEPAHPDAMEVTGKITSKYPQTRVVVMTTFVDEDLLLCTLNDGAAGYLLKGIEKTGELLPQILHHVHKGFSVFSEDVFRKMRKWVPPRWCPDPRIYHIWLKLDQECQRIVKELCHGKKEKEIPGITHGMVRNRMNQKIFAAFGLNQKSERKKSVLIAKITGNPE